MTRFWLCVSLCATIASWLALTGPAAAKTCSEQLEVCQGYCARSEGGSPACLRVCGAYLRSCLGSGCWESKIVARQCGFERR